MMYWDLLVIMGRLRGCYDIKILVSRWRNTGHNGIFIPSFVFSYYISPGGRDSRGRLKHFEHFSGSDFMKYVDMYVCMRRMAWIWIPKARIRTRLRSVNYGVIKNNCTRGYVELECDFYTYDELSKHAQSGPTDRCPEKPDLKG